MNKYMYIHIVRSMRMWASKGRSGKGWVGALLRWGARRKLFHRGSLSLILVEISKVHRSFFRLEMRARGFNNLQTRMCPATRAMIDFSSYSRRRTWVAFWKWQLSHKVTPSRSKLCIHWSMESMWYNPAEPLQWISRTCVLRSSLKTKRVLAIILWSSSQATTWLVYRENLPKANSALIQGVVHVQCFLGGE